MAFGFLKRRFFRPVKGKPIQKGWTIFVAADLEELTLEALV